MGITSIFKNATIGFDDLSSPPRIAILRRGKMRCIPLQDDTEARLLRRIKAGSSVAAAMKPRQSLLLGLQRPIFSESKIVKVLASLLDPHLPFAIEEAHVAFSISPPLVSSDKIICTATTQENLSERISELRQRDANPEYLLSPGTALWREFEQLAAVDERECILLHTTKHGDLMVFGCGKKFIAAHPCRRNDSAMLKRIILSVFSNREQVYWSISGEATDPSTMAAAINDDTCNRQLRIHEPENLLAQALARAASEKTTLNLRNREAVHAASEKQRNGPLFATATILLLLSALLFAYSTYAIISAKRSFATANQKAQKTTSTVAGYPLPTRGVSAIVTARREWEQRHEPAIFSITTPSALSPAVIVLNAASELGITVHKLRTTPRTFKLTCSVTSPTTADALKASLAQSNYIIEVSRQSTHDNETPILLVTGELSQ